MTKNSFNNKAARTTGAGGLKSKINTIKLADALGLQRTGTRVLCPVHNDHHPSMKVYDNGYKCFSCGWKGDAIDLVEKVMDKNFEQSKQWLLEHLAQIERQPGDDELLSVRSLPASGQTARKGTIDKCWLVNLMTNYPLTPQARHFLFDERFLSPKVVEYCRLSAICRTMPCSANGMQGSFTGPALLIPYFDLDGSLIDMQSRYLGEKGHGQRFKFPEGSGTPPLYGQQLLKGLPPDVPVVVTEGISDCWTALSMRMVSVAVASSTTFDTGCVRLLEDRPLHMWPDQDRAGLDFYFRMKKLFPQLVYHQLPSGFKDLSEFYVHLRQKGMTMPEARHAVCNNPIKK